MKIIPAETMAQMQALFDSGHGMRATARVLGLHRDTVRKYYHQTTKKLCGCGKPLTHKGWCSLRVARSPGRQNMLRRKFHVIGNSIAIKWSERAELDARRTAYFEVKARLDAAWRKQTIMRENMLLGTDHLIAIATAEVNRRLRAPIIAEDVVQDLLVMMLEGVLEAANIRTSPLVGRAINREWGMVWAASKVSFDTGGPDDDLGLHNLIDESASNMTQEEFMAVAWRDFILWAHDSPEMRAAFAKATGHVLMMPAKNAIDAAIDEATGVHSTNAAAFVRWVTENHWGMDAAPEEYRRACEEAVQV